MKTIFITGGYFGVEYIRYVTELTGKSYPKICMIPTAVGDDQKVIENWNLLCENLPLIPHVLRTFISSGSEKNTFEDTLLGMDAIVVHGGNTLNMLAVWKAQGIDRILKQAYDKGIVLCGGSAGSLCWFESGPSDSKPQSLCDITCLGLLPFSHCPHYHSEADRRPFYQKSILEKLILPGYACDDKAGLLFINGELKKVVATDQENNSYFVSLKEGHVHEKLLPAEIILNSKMRLLNGYANCC